MVSFCFQGQLYGNIGQKWVKLRVTKCVCALDKLIHENDDHVRPFISMFYVGYCDSRSYSFMMDVPIIYKPAH